MTPEEYAKLKSCFRELPPGELATFIREYAENMSVDGLVENQFELFNLHRAAELLEGIE